MPTSSATKVVLFVRRIQRIGRLKTTSLSFTRYDHHCCLYLSLISIQLIEQEKEKANEKVFFSLLLLWLTLRRRRNWRRSKSRVQFVWRLPLLVFPPHQSELWRRVILIWTYRLLPLRLWPLVAYREKMRIFLSPVQQWVEVAALLTNCHTCFYGNRAN